MMDGEKIVSYIVFARGGKTVIKGSTRNDIFTVFVTTHPEYRHRGLAKKIVYTMLHEIGLRYETSYKTISDSNTYSQRVALANGYKVLYPVGKSKLLKTISQLSSGEWKLYAFE